MRGKNAHVPGSATLTSSPIMNVISPASTQATSSLSRCRWKRLLVPAGTVSSNSMTLSFVSRPRSFRAAKRPGAPMSRCVPPPAGTTMPLLAFMEVPPDTRDVSPEPLEETPAVALEVERLVDAILAQVIVQTADDLGTRRDRALVVRVDVIDVHGDVLRRGADRLRAERAMGALRAEPDHAAAELDHRVVDRAVRAHAPRGRNLAEPERALEERERGADILVRKSRNDRRSSNGLNLLLDHGHEYRLSSLQRCRVERGISPKR